MKTKEQMALEIAIAEMKINLIDALLNAVHFVLCENKEKER